MNTSLTQKQQHTLWSIHHNYKNSSIHCDLYIIHCDPFIIITKTTGYIVIHTSYIVIHSSYSQRQQQTDGETQRCKLTKSFIETLDRCVWQSERRKIIYSQRIKFNFWNQFESQSYGQGLCLFTLAFLWIKSIANNSMFVFRGIRWQWLCSKCLP